ncbi:hypothetical protein [Pseudomonas nitroreducens]|uniref:Uncharacterized protein n=1 Tax=Pseudomonas nitroreducens TaxID=46680 RepID=A0A6G6IRA5_PSENT|nr:hypothetical protein [Pseudomonas nitroreducens]QIE84771.1 hypothetical protein G5B91_00185 [Pseudomonas nitroreducens]
MGYCKICDIVFFVFLAFVFVLYVNPKAFSVKAHQEAIAENNRIERAKEQRRQENLNVLSCASKTTFKSSRIEGNHLQTEAHKFRYDLTTQTCNESVEFYVR